MTPIISPTPSGLYCAAGDFYIDPWRPVDRAVITHAHGDHARWGSRAYLGSREGERVLRTRLGPEARIRERFRRWEDCEVTGLTVSGDERAMRLEGQGRRINLVTVTTKPGAGRPR